MLAAAVQSARRAPLASARPLQWAGPSRTYAEYSERPVPKSQRKPLVHGVLLDPDSVQEIKAYRFSKEWHIYKRRFEVPLVQAFQTFLDETEQERVAEKKAKRKARRDDTADIRRRHHMIQKKKQALTREAMIVRPWEKAVDNMEDTFNWSMLKNPFTGSTDENSKYDLHKQFTPDSLLSVESWLFYNRTHWSQIPFLSNIYNPPEDSLAGLMRMAAQDQHEDDVTDDEAIMGDIGPQQPEKGEVGARNEFGDLKEHMPYDPETAKMALDHTDQFNVLRDSGHRSENWVPRTDHGCSLVTEQPAPLPEPEAEATDTDIGEDDFAGDGEASGYVAPCIAHIKELIEPKGPLHPDDQLFMNPLSHPIERQGVYDSLQLLLNMPDPGQVRRLKQQISPKHVLNILTGAQRAGLSAPDVNFLKEFLEDQRAVSNEQLERFKHVITPGFRERLLASMDIEENTKERGKARRFFADGTSKVVNDDAVDLVQEGPKIPSEEDKFIARSKFVVSELESEASDGNGSEIEEFDLAESPVDAAAEGEAELDFDQAETTASADYFIDYAFRLKKILNFHMRQQLMEHGLLSGQDEEYMLVDPPRLHVDLDPCVEIIHVSHIQSLTGYDRLEHVQRKVVFKIKMAYLNFPPEVMERFSQIVGRRYDPESGVFRFVSKAQHNKHQNTIHGIRQIRKLFEAAFEASPYYLPVQGAAEGARIEDTVDECPTQPKVYEMYEAPYVRPKPWLPEDKRLRPRDPYYVFRPFPVGWDRS